MFEINSGSLIVGRIEESIFFVVIAFGNALTTIAENVIQPEALIDVIQ